MIPAHYLDQDDIKRRTALVMPQWFPEDVDAVYLVPLAQLTPGEFEKLIDGLNTRRLPTFSLLGREHVERGILAGAASQSLFERFSRRVALDVQAILLGEAPERLPVAISTKRRLSINMATARAIGVYPSFSVLTEAELLNPIRTEIERSPRRMISR